MAVSAGSIFLELQVDDSGMVTGIKRAGGALQTFQQTLNQTTAAAKKMDDAHESLGTRFRHLVVTMGNLRFVAMDVHDVFLRLPLAILKTSGELERMQKLLGGLSTATTQAGKDMEAAGNFKFITEMAQKAPFQIKSLSDAFVKFKSAGLDPTNGSLQALVDGVAKFGGNGESLQRASVAIQQMAGKGVVSMEELRQQLGEAVPTAMKLMAEGMGMSMAELTKAVSKGTVEARDAIGKMLVMMRLDSSGAASEMMDTWVGVQEQLKTRLSLAAKEVADAGFGDASKQVARDISDGLNSLQVKQLTDSLGTGLAQTLRQLSDAAGFLISQKDNIWSLVQAFVAYKVAAGGVAPALTGMITQIKAVNQEYKNQQIVSTMIATQTRNEAMAKVQAAGSVAQAQMAATAQTIAALNEEMAFRRAQAAELQVEKMAASKALSYSSGDAYGPIDRKQVQEYRENIRQLETDNASAMRRIQGDIDNVKTAHADAAKSVMQHGNTLDSLVGTATRASFAVNAMATATRVAGNVFNALGGWATILNIAIGAGIYLWMNWGKAAEEAAARAERARKGLADQRDYEGLIRDQEKLVQGRRLLLQRVEDLKRIGADKDGASQNYIWKQTQVELEANQRQQNQMMGRLSEANVSASRERARGETNQIIANSDAKIEAIQREKTREYIAEQQKFEELTKAAGDNKAKLSKINEDKKKSFFGIEQRGTAKEVSFLEERIAQLRKEAAGPNSEAALDAIKVLTEKLNSAKASLESATKFSGKSVFISGKSDSKPANDSPIQKAIEKFREDRVKLEAELAGFDGVKNKADKVAGAVAEIYQKLHDGDYNDPKTGARPSGDKLRELLKEAVGKTEADDALDESKKRNEKAAADLKTATNFIEGMRPEVEQAMELLANPLETATRGASESKVEKWISRNKDQIKAYADEQKLTVEQVEKTLRHNSVMVDTSKEFAKVEQETKRINGSLVNDSREAAVQRMRADNQELQTKLDNLITHARAHGATQEEITRLEKIAGDNRTAHAAEVSEKAKSPMQKMADQWANSTKNMEDATARWANGSVDAFVNFAKTGKLEFGQLADSIVSDLLRITMQKQLAGAMGAGGDMLTGFFSNMFADGGIMTSGGSMPLKKYAAGGIANSPQMAVFGEGSMNEAYVPLPDGRSIPVTMKGAMGGAPVINIIEAPGKGGQTATRTENGVSITDVMVEKISTKIASDISRGVGPVNGAITNTFGLNRAAGAY